MKRILALAMAICALLSVSSCGSNDSSSDAKQKSSSKQESISNEASVETNTDSESTDTDTDTDVDTDVDTNNEDNYLQNIEVKVLDVTNCTQDEAALDIGYLYTESDIDKDGPATIFTVETIYNSSEEGAKFPILIDSTTGEDLNAETYDTSYKFVDHDNDDKIVELTRYRVPGKYTADNVKLRYYHYDSEEKYEDKDLTTNGNYEDLAKYFSWSEDIDEKYADEAKLNSATVYPYLYKIGGRYYYVSTPETINTDGFGAIDNTPDYVPDKVNAHDREIRITPMQGIQKNIITEDSIKFESGKTQPFVYSYIGNFEDHKTYIYLSIVLACDSNSSFYNEFDSMSEKDKLGADDVYQLEYAYLREEARKSFISITVGNETTKIPCTEHYNTGALDY